MRVHQVPKTSLAILNYVRGGDGSSHIEGIVNNTRVEREPGLLEYHRKGLSDGVKRVADEHWHRVRRIESAYFGQNCMQGSEREAWTMSRIVEEFEEMTQIPLRRSTPWR